MAIDAIYMVRLLKSGYPKEHLVVVVIIIIPASIFIAKYLGDITQRIKELTTFWYGFFWKLLSTFIFYWIADYYSRGEIDDMTVSVLLVLNGHINLVGDLSFTIGAIAFGNKIAEKEIAGTYITFFTAMGLMGKFGSYTSMLFVAESGRFLLMAIIGWVYSVIFLWVNKDLLFRI